MRNRIRSAGNQVGRRGESAGGRGQSSEQTYANRRLMSATHGLRRRVRLESVQPLHDLGTPALETKACQGMTEELDKREPQMT